MSITKMNMPHKNIQIWLYTVCFMIFAMAVIGAVTRLTESGLSIVEWRPVTGFLPPLSEQEWQRVYELYKQSPEFRHKHYWMEIGDFKRIFFWEWLHRLWGRLIGVVFALPLLFFAITKQIPKGYGWKLGGLFLLGGAQGALGWWMVKSGLVDIPSVSHFRLAAHLGLALIVFSLTFSVALSIQSSPLSASLPSPRKRGDKGGRGLLMHAGGMLFLLSLTIIWGAFTAGLDAGLVYNSWPLMNGSFTPPEQFNISSIIENHGWVQFTHRWIAFLTGAGILVLALRTRDRALGIMVVIQIALGIMTLLTQVMIPLAALHQAGAIILLALLLRNLFQITNKEKL
ncbi:MAG: COX15/CtaA family protein [Rhodospirillales bacterium]|nr:COX15/CtaA family protein [Rhodospirillales bacterium]MCB9996302.1 COX15/CtaA family protein [Rhodospirillales bacterium]